MYALSAETVVDYLVQRGVVTQEVAAVRVTSLSGGVSNEAYVPGGSVGPMFENGDMFWTPEVSE